MIRILSKPEGGVLSLVEGAIPASLALEALPTEKPRVWLDLTAPTKEEVDLIQRHLRFGDYSWEDALRGDHPPKVEEVGEDGERPAYLFVVARAPAPDGASEGVALFMRSRLLVSVHAQPSARVDAAIERVLRDPKKTMGYGIELVAHAVLDEIVECYGPAIDEIEGSMEELESRVANDFESCGLDVILRLRQKTTYLYREVRPMRDVMASLAREGHPLIKSKARLAFRDLYDHIQRTLDRLESDRELMASLRDAYLALQNNRMNEVMKALTVVAVISGALAVVTGALGMNLHIPGAESPYGFAAALFMMVGVSAAIFVLFRWKRWV